MFAMVDTGVRVDEEIKRFLDAEKLVERESYKSVIKRLIAKVKIVKGR